MGKMEGKANGEGQGIRSSKRKGSRKRKGRRGKGMKGKREIFWILASVRTGSLFRDNSSFSSELTVTSLISSTG